MSVRLAVVTTDFLKDFTQRTLTEIEVPFDYDLFIYDSFSNIADVYDGIPRGISGIITSGRFAAEAIRQAHPDTSRVITSFDADDAGLYWLFLQLMREGKSDFSRVYVDFFDVMGIDLEKFVNSRLKSSVSDLLTDYMRGMTLDRLLKVEKYCINKHTSLWRQGKIDVSVTRFSSIAQYLEDKGVPVRFAYPSAYHVKDVCQQAFQRVQIRQLRQNLLAVIEVTVDSGANDGGRLMELEQLLDNFKKTSLYDFLMMEVTSGFEILTSRKVVSELTGKYTGCRLQEYLRQKLRAPVYVGYGIGNDMYQARGNAIAANREARLYENGGSCLINENNEMLPHLESLRRFVIRRDAFPALTQASKKSGLSSLTIQKIIAIAREMDGHRVTSQDIANKLGITRRSANRFLSALAKTKTAKVVSEKSLTTKGRPERIYQIAVPD